MWRQCCFACISSFFFVVVVGYCLCVDFQQQGPCPRHTSKEGRRQVPQLLLSFRWICCFTTPHLLLFVCSLSTKNLFDSADLVPESCLHYQLILFRFPVLCQNVVWWSVVFLEQKKVPSTGFCSVAGVGWGGAEFALSGLLSFLSFSTLRWTPRELGMRWTTCPSEPQQASNQSARLPALQVSKRGRRRRRTIFFWFNCIHPGMSAKLIKEMKKFYW